MYTFTTIARAYIRLFFGVRRLSIGARVKQGLGIWVKQGQTRVKQTPIPASWFLLMERYGKTRGDTCSCGLSLN